MHALYKDKSNYYSDRECILSPNEMYGDIHCTEIEFHVAAVVAVEAVVRVVAVAHVIAVVRVVAVVSVVPVVAVVAIVAVVHLVAVVRVVDTVRSCNTSLATTLELSRLFVAFIFNLFDVTWIRRLP